MYTLHLGDCLTSMRTMPDNSVDAIVTDPPYGLSFMGKKWDYDVPSVEIWQECLRVLKPGGHLLAFAGTRTQHRMAVRIEDAGFEIRDMLAWVYGSGFPKSMDVSKAIDKAAGAEREVVGNYGRSFRPHSENTESGWDRPSHDVHGSIIAPATPEAKQWEGWGTALKPALEPITLARKPFKGTVASNVLEHGVGALNIDGCRVGECAGWSYPNGRGGKGCFGERSLETNLTTHMEATKGRWPANIIHDGSPEVDEVLGTASRFFYCAKASKADREEGCDALPLTTHQSGMGGAVPVDDKGNDRDRFKAQSRNHHPTVKPTDLMRHLCRLITPPNGTILDPFMGSGSTGKAALLESFNFIGCELSPEYMEISKSRLLHTYRKLNQNPTPCIPMLEL